MAASLTTSSLSLMGVPRAEWIFNKEPILSAVSNVIDPSKSNKFPKELVELVISYLKYNIDVISVQQWKEASYEVEPAPAFPSNIDDICTSICPIFRNNKMVCETHQLVYFPNKINGKSRSGDLSSAENREVLTALSKVNTVSSGHLWIPSIAPNLDLPKSIDQACWVLLTKDPLPKRILWELEGLAARNLIVDIDNRNLIPYNQSNTLEAIYCFLKHFFNSTLSVTNAEDRGDCLIPKEPFTVEKLKRFKCHSLRGCHLLDFRQDKGLSLDIDVITQVAIEYFSHLIPKDLTNHQVSVLLINGTSR